MFGNIGDMIKQAKALQDNMQKMQEEVAAFSVVGQSGGGMVVFTLNGKGIAQSVKFDESLKGEELEVLEDLITAAYNDAKNKLDSTLEEKMQSMAQGLNLPEGFGR